MPYYDEIIKSFWAKVNIRGPDDCWEWTGAVNGRDYGRFYVGDKTVYAHRLAWELTSSSIPKGKLVLHKCDNPTCCNPDHLYVGTHCDNMADLTSRHPELPGMGRVKLYKNEIQLIRDLKQDITTGRRKEYKIPMAYVAKMFKVSRNTICRIWNSDKQLCREGYYV